jgi:dihydroxyacid dehydratase/phosphogluconate dehydratase
MNAMAKVHAGDIITIEIEGQLLTAKVEDASKSETIMAKVESSQASRFTVGTVYEFARNCL